VLSGQKPRRWDQGSPGIVGGPPPGLSSTGTTMDYDNYTYLTITLSKHSRYFDNPTSITSTHPSFNYCGRVGEFSDVHLISVPKNVWLRDGSALMSQLIGSDGVLDVDVQVLRTRSKRHMEEL
jgi:hypothetical protein